MAQRRMTSLEVIDTDVFLDMPVSSQLLYFHLNARADDDGFIASPKKIARSVQASTDDMRILLAKKFLIEFEDGVCVIKHWRMNNYIRKDRYTETKYLDHKQALYIRRNGAYTLTSDSRAVKVPLGHFKIEDIIGDDTGRLPSGVPDGVPTGDAGKDRLGKDRLGKDSVEKKKKPYQSISYLSKIPKDDVAEFIKKFNVEEEGVKSKAEDLLNYCQAHGKRYKNYKAMLRNAIKSDFGLRGEQEDNFVSV